VRNQISIRKNMFDYTIQKKTDFDSENTSLGKAVRQAKSLERSRRESPLKGNQEGAE